MVRRGNPQPLPPQKKSKSYTEAIVSPSVSSQQDMDFEMADEQYLGFILSIG